MTKHRLRSFAPGLVRALGSTALCLVMTSALAANDRFATAPFQIAQAPNSAGSIVTINPVTPSSATDPAYTFSASRANGGTVLSGQLPTDAAMQSFATLTSGNTEAVTLAGGAPAGFLADAEIGLRALQRLDFGRLDFSSGQWRLSGTAPNEATRTAIAATIAYAADPAQWAAALEVVASASAATAAPTAASADVGLCRETLAEFSGRNSILFQSGAAVITTDSEPALDELARDLAACPDAAVHIEGHTDADGEERQNLALSVARAEAVINALIARQVQPERLYAVGYGESNPIAANDTPDGKRLNRRIVVTVPDEQT